MSKRFWGVSLACALGATTITIAAEPDLRTSSRRRATSLKRLPGVSSERPAGKMERAQQGRGSAEGAGKTQPRAEETDRGATYSATGGSSSLVPPVNDDCVDQLPISGYGPHAFDNAEATVEPGSPEHSLCALFDDPLIVHDVWYCWTASELTEIVRLDTCGERLDTKIAVYDRCDCLPGDNNLLTCNDDACELSAEFESSVTFEAQAGQSYLIRVGTTSLFEVPGGSGSFTFTPIDLPCDSGSAQFCQQPSGFDARVSNRTTDTVADNFTPAVTGEITEVCWWGIYVDAVGDCQGGAPDDFRIRYYTDAGGTPGALLAEFTQTAVDPADRLTLTGPVATPEFLPEYDPFFPAYEYTATHAAVSVIGDDCYWIEISNSVADWCVWHWELGDSDNGRALWDRDGFDPPAYRVTDVVALDQAFCLDIQMGDAAQQCPLPNPCGTSDTDCCADNLGTETVGCGEVDCCEAVCARDPFCCAIGWDEFCAGNPGGAGEFCPGLCCPEGEAGWATSDPMSGVVDARQPRDIEDGVPLLGIRGAFVAAPPGADDIGCWDACETDAEGGANFIRTVSDRLDGTYAITLNRRITPGAVTEITYGGATGGTGTGTFTSLPGDSNADNVSNSNDVLSLIDCCLNETCPAPYGDYSCDMNHSGQATGEDLLRLIDLLNGAGAFTRSWYGATPELNNPCQ